MSADWTPTARVTFLGDTLVGGEAQPVLDRRGAQWALDGIRPILAASDLVVANHEGPLTRRDEPGAKLDTGRKRYWYRAEPNAAAALREAGIRVVSLGNNHVLDFGVDGLLDTIEVLDEHGILHCGAGVNRAAARRPAIIEVNGLRLGFVSFMQRYDVYVAEGLYATRDRAGPSRLRIDRARTDLRRLTDAVDLPVALVHWGRNYRRANPRQRRLAKELVAAGAGLVIGHHPHIPQRIRTVGGAPVCFSLGNGPLGTPGRFHSGRPPYGLVVTFDLDGAATLRRMTVTVIVTDNAVVGFQPRPADDVEAAELLRRILPANLAYTYRAGVGAVADLPGATALVDPARRCHELQAREEPQAQEAQCRTTASAAAATHAARPASPESM